MSAALVQHTTPATQQLNGTTTAATFASPTTTGDFLAVVVTAWKTSQADPGITVADNKGNTYSAAFTAPGTSVTAKVYLFYVANAAGGTTHTVTATANAAAFITMSISEWSDVATSTPTDGSHTTAAGTATTATPGSITPTANGDLIINVMTEDNGVSVSTPSSGYTILDNIVTGQDLHAQYLIQGTAGATNPGMSVGSGNNWADGIAAFKAAAGGTSGQTVAVTGHTSQASYGTVTPSTGAVSVSVTGRTSTASYGTVTPTSTVTKAVTGHESSASYGSVTAVAGNVNVSVTGHTSTASYGTVTPTAGAVTIAVGGHESSAGYGTATGVGEGVVAVTGHLSTASYGTVTPSVGGVALTVTGRQSQARYGTVGIEGQAAAVLGYDQTPVFIVTHSH